MNQTILTEQAANYRQLQKGGRYFIMEMQTLQGKSLVFRLMAILGASLFTLAMIACAGQPATSNAVDAGDSPPATAPNSEAVGAGDTPTATSPTTEALEAGDMPTVTSPTSEAVNWGDTPEPTSATVPEVPLEPTFPTLRQVQQGFLLTE